jgi:hypothetical protein
MKNELEAEADALQAEIRATAGQLDGLLNEGSGSLTELKRGAVQVAYS